MDAFRFKTTGGAINLTVTTSAPGSNLDILAQVINASTGTVVATANVSSTLSANIATTLAAGEYLFTVTGTGYGDPANLTGYSNYGSIGSYSITGTVTNGETHQAFSIAEHSANGTVLGTITPRTVTGSPLTYTIASGNTGSALALNASTGSLTVASSTALNYETFSTRYDDPALLELFVTITNPGTSASETVRVVVTVTDVNEAPVITSGTDTTIIENTAAGTNVLQVSGTDSDRFDFPSYLIASGNDAGYFAIDAGTGWISIANPPVVSTDTTVSLVIQAKDQKTTPLYSTTRTVNILIRTLPSNFTGTPGGIYRTFFLNITGSAVANLTASPNFPNAPDEEVYLTAFDGGGYGDNYGSTIRGYVIPPTTGSYQFWVASDNASQLILGSGTAQTSTPVIASVSTYSGQYAWDQNASQASSTVTLTAGQPYYIEVRHKEETGGDHAAVAWSGPGFTRRVIPGLYLAPFYQNYAPRPSGSLKVSEAASAGAVVGQLPVVEVNQQDSLGNYAIVGGSGANLFAINADTGNVTVAVAGQFDAVTTPYYDITFSVTDDGTPALTGTGVVRINMVPNQFYFDPNGTTAGSVVNSGTYTWLTTSWAAALGGTMATQAWIPGAEAFFSATTPAGPLSYSVDIASYNSATHGGFGAIEALAGTVKFIGNVANFYLTGNVAVTADPGAAIEFNQTCTSNSILAFNLNGQTATFNGNVTFNTCGPGNTGNVVVNSGVLDINYPAQYSGITTLGGGILNASTLSNYGVAGSLGNRASGSEASGNIGLLFRGGTLQYTGSTAQSTNRQIRIGTEGGAIDASGSNPSATVSFTHSGANTDLYNSPGNRTLTLTGSNTGANFFAIGLTDQNAISGRTSLLKSGDGTWVLTGTGTYTGGTTIERGTLQINSPTSLPGAVTILADSNNENLFGTLFMNAGNTTWSQNVSGAGRWKIATGSGSQTTALTGTYTGFNGTLEVATGSGKISLLNSTGYPAAGSTIQLDANTSMMLSGGGTLASRFRLFGGSIGEPSYGQLRIATVDATLTGDITLSGSTTIAVDTGRIGVIRSVIGESGGSFGFTKNQSGTLEMTGINTYTGGTVVSAGLLRTGTGTSRFGPGNITVATGATCSVQNTTVALGRQAFVYLNGTGKLDLVTGATETVARLYINGVQQPANTYTAANLASNITGNGSLIVGESVPDVPANFAVTLASTSAILLTWNHVSVNETDLRIERSLSPTTGFAEIATLAPGVTSCLDGNLPANTTFYYRIRVGNAVGYSAYTNVGSATTGVTEAPAGLTATGSNAAVILSWTANPEATGYNVKRATVSGGPYSTVGSPTGITFTDTTVVNGTVYYYVATALVAGGGESQPCDEVSARPLPPAGNGTWTDSSGGNWSDVDNWQSFIIADGTGKSATFSQAGGGVITVDTAGRTLGSLNFSNGTYTLQGQSLTLDGTSGAPAISVASGKTATIAVPLSGTEGMTKTSPGRLILSNSNTYTGTTSVTSGTLTLQGTYAGSAFAISSGAVLDLEAGASAMNYAAVTFSGTGTLRKSGANKAYWGASAATFALASGALIDVQGGTFTAGSSANEVWTNNLSDLNVATGAVFDGVEANVRVDGISGSGTIKTGYSGASYTNFTIGVNNGSSTFNGVIANSISTGNLTKQGSGTITLAGSNTFTGSVGISDGVLRIKNSGGLGSGTKSVTINATADKWLELDGSTSDITLASGITFQTSGVNGVVRNVAGNNRINGTFSMTMGNGNTRIVSDGGGLTVAGNVSAAASGRLLDLSGTSTGNNTFSGSLSNTNTPALSKTGLGTWILSGSSSYAGVTTVSEGTLRIRHNNALGSTAGGTTVETGATLQLDGTSLNVAENFTLGTGTNGATVENVGGNNTLSGTITRNGALNFVSTSGKLTVRSNIGDTSNTVNMQGDGDGEISGSITLAYSVNKTGNGTWTLSGSSSYTTATAISAGRLILSGSLTSPITVSGGSLAPQGAPLTSSSLNVQSGGRLEVRPGDTLSVGGSVTLAGNLDIIAAPGLAPGSSFRILNKTSAGAIGGTFAGKSEGSVFSASGYNWIISYTGGSGNDVVLTVATGQQTWRYENFGTLLNSGTAADTADPNKDGETNFLEFATGQNPNAATTRPGTLAKTVAGLEFTYTRSKTAFDAGVIFSVEYSDTLAAPWTSVGPGSVVIDGTIQTVKATVPAGSGAKRFVRLKVTQP